MSADRAFAHSGILDAGLSPACTFTYDTLRAAFPKIEQRVTWFDCNYGACVRTQLRKLDVQPDDLLDVYQEAIVAFWLWPGLETLPPEQYFPVVCTICCYKACDLGRRQQRQPRRIRGEILDSLATDDWPLRGQLSAVDTVEFRVLLDHEIARLPPAEQQVARLYVDNIEEFGPRDIFEKLQQFVHADSGQLKSVHTIKNLWHAARPKLCAALRPQYQLAPGELP